MQCLIKQLYVEVSCVMHPLRQFEMTA